jgi:hypothetical protein
MPTPVIRPIQTPIHFVKARGSAAGEWSWPVTEYVQSLAPSETTCTEHKPTWYEAPSADRIVTPPALLQSFPWGCWINLIIDWLTAIDERYLAALFSFVPVTCLYSIGLWKYRENDLDTRYWNHRGDVSQLLGCLTYPAVRGCVAEFTWVAWRPTADHWLASAKEVLGHPRVSIARV